MLGLLVGLLGVVAIVGGDFAASDATALLAIVVVVVGYALGPAIRRVVWLACRRWA